MYGYDRIALVLELKYINNGSAQQVILHPSIHTPPCTTPRYIQKPDTT